MSDSKVITNKSFDKISSIKYGFFTRCGGFSEGEFNSLNINSKVENGESKENVLKNFNVIKKFFNTQNNVFKMKQTHSNKVFILNDLKWLNDIDIIEADAVITKLKNVVIGVSTADCVPILLIDEINQIVCAIHAGWKGVILGIIENSIIEMKKLGAQYIKALVGPHLKVDNFEIQQDFIKFLEENKINYKDFVIFKNGKIFFDISKFVETKLKNNCISSVDVEIDTYSNSDLFFSYRRSTHENKEKCGCQFSGIMLK